MSTSGAPVCIGLLVTAPRVIGLGAVLTDGGGVFVEQLQAFVLGQRGQQQRDLAETKIVDGVPVVGFDGRAEHRQRHVVACTVTHLTDALLQFLDRVRI